MINNHTTHKHLRSIHHVAKLPELNNRKPKHLVSKFIIYIRHLPKRLAPKNKKPNISGFKYTTPKRSTPNLH